MIGAAVGVVVWIVALRALRPRGRIVLAALAVAGLFAVSAASRVMPTNVRAPNPASGPPPLVERFNLQLGVAEPASGSSVGSRLPWRVLRIGSNLAFDYVPVDRPGALCLSVVGFDAPEGVETFRALRSTLASLPEQVDCGLPCPTCDEVGLEWYLDQARFTLHLNDRCWSTNETVRPLRLAIEHIVATYGADPVCEPAGS
jgi:hypothetical protein